MYRNGHTKNQELRIRTDMLLQRSIRFPVHSVLRGFFVGLFSIVSLAGGVGLAADVVTVSTKDGRNQSRMTGEILDFNGLTLKIQLSSGREESVPTERVIDVQTSWQPEHTQADELFQNGDFAEAVKLYQQAVRAEKREWVQRKILAQLVRCYGNLRQVPRAVETFASIFRNDPQTQYFDSLPISWTRSTPDATLVTQAKAWLKLDTQPLLVLVGASWLISLGERIGVDDPLKRLSNHSDPRIAHLADAQRWRLRIATATAEDVARWQKQVERMPESLRAGPYYLLGQMQARLGQHEPAALAFLRVPVHFPTQRDLGAESLLAAGRELDTMGQRTEAASLYRAVIEQHRSTPFASTAEERLKNLTNQGSDRAK